jgi:hypothetical protein
MAGGGNQLFSKPFCLGFSRGFNGGFNLFIFQRRKPHGNESAALFLIGQHWAANFSFFAHNLQLFTLDHKK